jgi:hypothetical protein
VGYAYVFYNDFQKRWVVKDNYSHSYFIDYKDAVEYAKNPESPVKAKAIALKKTRVLLEVEDHILDYTSKLRISRKEALQRVIGTYKTVIKEYKGNDKDYIPDYKLAIEIAKSLQKKEQ